MRISSILCESYSNVKSGVFYLVKLSSSRRVGPTAAALDAAPLRPGPAANSRALIKLSARSTSDVLTIY